MRRRGDRTARSLLRRVSPVVAGLLPPGPVAPLIDIFAKRKSLTSSPEIGAQSGNRQNADKPLCAPASRLKMQSQERVEGANGLILRTES
jgi:hypothetical protein